MLTVGDGKNRTGKDGQAQMTEPKDEEQGEYVAGQFVERHFSQAFGAYFLLSVCPS